MISKTEQILQDALELPPVERAELAESLLASFLLPLDKDIDALWAQETEDRIDAYEEGRIKSVSAKKVFNKLTSSNQ
ncbi:MAG TPA: addiction module protein [bacterium]|nr:addiction module protein [bacterium]